MRLGSKQPAFGIVGAPTVPAAPGTPAVDETAYGFVPRDRLRTDRPGPEPVLDACLDAARRGDWTPIAAALPTVVADPDRYLLVVSGVADLAADDDGWLNAWLDAAPTDPHAWGVHAQTLVVLAWKLRTGAPAPDVLREQWMGFHRVLRQAPAAAERATALAPGLAAPWIALMACAQGLSWEQDRFREIWAEVLTRAPHSVAAHTRALSYWLPRWHGSDELAAGFVAETLQRAAPGRLLTGIRLLYLYYERVPGANAAPYYRGAELAEALDAAVADLAAAPADHPYRPHHRHWLAYFLTKAGRYAEAVEEFRAIDGYAGARPWDLFPDPAGTLAATRAEALLGRQRGQATVRPGAAGP